MEKLYKDGVLLYEGEIRNGKPFGQGTVCYPDGKPYQEGIFGIKGLISGKEYYSNGSVRFSGTYRVNMAYGPNWPEEGEFYAEDGTLIYSGKFEIRRGGVGFPSVVVPEEYGPVVQKDAPDYNWCMYDDVK